MAERDRTERRGRTWTKRVGWTATCLVLTAVVVGWGFPRLLSSNLLRNRLVRESVSGLGVDVRTDGAGFGWLPPTRVVGLRVTSPGDQIDVRADRLRIDRAWWQLAFRSDRLGHVEVENPSVTIRLDRDDQGGYSLESLPAMTAELRDADFKLRLADMREPVIDVGGSNVGLRVDRDKEGYLTIEPGKIFDRRPLTPKMCDGLLQLMDPTLGEVVHVEGSFSLDVERLRIPLNVDPGERLGQVEFEGVLHLHEVTTKAKTPLLRRVLRVASDLYGKRPAEVVRIVEDNRIRVSVRQGRFHHDRLVLGFPEISEDLRIYSRGSVGLDETLDLELTIPEVLVAEDPESAERTRKLRYHVTGTVNQPKVTPMAPDDGNELSAGENGGSHEDGAVPRS